MSSKRNDICGIESSQPRFKVQIDGELWQDVPQAFIDADGNQIISFVTTSSGDILVGGLDSSRYSVDENGDMIYSFNGNINEAPLCGCLKCKCNELY